MGSYTRAAPSTRSSGAWNPSSARRTLVGGKPEAGETPDLTLRRELAEEIGVELAASDLRALGSFTAVAANEPGFLQNGSPGLLR